MVEATIVMTAMKEVNLGIRTIYWCECAARGT